MPGENQNQTLAEILRMAGEAKRVRDAETIRERHLLYHADIFGYATVYDNAIVLSGYAAFFGLWAGVSDDVTRTCRLVTVALMGMSLILYISWQIGTMLIRQRGEFSRADAFEHASNPEKFNEIWEACEIKAVTDNVLVMRFWPYVFVPQVVLGLLGASILTYNAAAMALGLPHLK